jgi:hypothetical protein
MIIAVLGLGFVARAICLVQFFFSLSSFFDLVDVEINVVDLVG